MYVYVIYVYCIYNYMYIYISTYIEWQDLNFISCRHELFRPTSNILRTNWSNISVTTLWCNDCATKKPIKESSQSFFSKSFRAADISMPIFTPPGSWTASLPLNMVGLEDDRFAFLLGFGNKLSGATVGCSTSGFGVPEFYPFSDFGEKSPVFAIILPSQVARQSAARRIRETESTVANERHELKVF